MDSTEIGNKAEKFARLFKRAQELGLERVSHAGEEGPAENIWDCLHCLGVSRIDHGVTCSQDERLLDELASRKIPLTVCPLSNIKLKVFKRLEDHNLKRLFDRGIRVTINSDDPAYFGGYLLDNYLACYTGVKLPVGDLVEIAKYSFEASFLPSEQVDKHLKEIDRIYENFKQSV